MIAMLGTSCLNTVHEFSRLRHCDYRKMDYYGLLRILPLRVDFLLDLCNASGGDGVAGQ